jgi:hypothetical protein
MCMLPIIAMLIMAPVAAPPHTARSRPQLVLVVRQETKPRLSDETLRRIGAEVAAVWRPYLDVALHPAESLAPYRGDDALRVILTDRQADGPTGPGLGWIDFVDGEPARTITASVTAAKALAGRGFWAGRTVSAWPPGLGDIFLVRALGRAIAHEVGHYVLRSKAHTTAGLMRATFTAEELMARSLAHYRLQPADAARLEAQATAYSTNRHRPEDLPLQW